MATRFATEAQWGADGSVYPSGDLLVVLPVGFSGASGSFPYRIANGTQPAARIGIAGTTQFTVPQDVVTGGLTNTQLRATPVPVSVTPPTVSFYDSPELQASAVIKEGSGTMIFLRGHNTGTAQYIMVFDAPELPDDGTFCPLVLAVGEQADFTLEFPVPKPFLRGLVVAASSNDSILAISSNEVIFNVIYT